MEIKKIMTYISQSPQKGEELSVRNRGEDRDWGNREVIPQQDRVELSGNYHELAKVKKVMMERDDIRTEQVDQVRKMLRNESYEVNPAATAEAMLGEMW